MHQLLWRQRFRRESREEVRKFISVIGPNVVGRGEGVARGEGPTFKDAQDRGRCSTVGGTGLPALLRTKMLKIVCADLRSM